MTIKEETLFTNEETVNSKQLAILKKYFPRCFDKQGKFIQEKMLEVVQASDTELSQESYGLNWLGKSYAQLLTNLPPETLISADTDHNQKEQNKNSNNLLIKGDNLEVLKHMVNAYSEKIKMIYIDPPYNTGSDGFVYNDNRKFTKQQLSELAGIEEDEAERILNFTDKGSNSHSAWLTFIYPRLYIARELLREDGVIFISIDDNEVSQLKMLCDEVFGESNFLDIFSWQKTTTPANLSNKTKKSCEYIISYEKNNCGFLKGLIKNSNSSNGLMNQNNKMTELIFPANIVRTNLADGIYKKGEYGTTSYTINLLNDVKVKNGLFIDQVYLEGKFKWSQKYLDKAIENNVHIFIQTKAFSPSYEKSEYDAEKPWNIINKKFGVGTNENASEELDDLFQKKFSFGLYPKPTSLIKYLLNMVTDKGLFFMDFFAGTGTTAHAVMQLNSEDGGNRQCISVQIDEDTDKNSEAFKAGYNTIFDITKARISKAGKKIQQENPEYKGDLGFKIYQTVEDFRDISDNEMVENCSDGSNIDVMPKKNLILQLDDKKLTKSQYQALLTTWCLYDGALLTTPIVDITLADYQAHLCDNRLYLLATDFSTEALKALLLKLDEDSSFAPHKIIFYGNNFESATQRELNEAVTSYANKKSLAIELVVRY